MDDQGDELAEEIMASDNIQEPRDLGVPVKFVLQPDYEMIDISRRPKPTTVSPNQIEPVEADVAGPSQPRPADMDTRDRDR